MHLMHLMPIFSSYFLFFISFSQLPDAVMQLGFKVDKPTVEQFICKYRGHSTKAGIDLSQFLRLADDVFGEAKKRQSQEYKKKVEGEKEKEQQKRLAEQKQKQRRIMIEQQETRRLNEEKRVKQMRNLAGMWKQHVLFGQKEWGVHDIKLTQEGDTIKGVIVKTTVQGKPLPITIGQDVLTGSINADSVIIKFRRTTDNYTGEHHLKIVKKGEMEGTWTSNANQKGNSRWYMV